MDHSSFGEKDRRDPEVIEPEILAPRPHSTGQGQQGRSQSQTGGRSNQRQSYQRNSQRRQRSSVYSQAPQGTLPFRILAFFGIFVCFFVALLCAVVWALRTVLALCSGFRDPSLNREMGRAFRFGLLFIVLALSCAVAVISPALGLGIAFSYLALRAEGAWLEASLRQHFSGRNRP